jgi:sugar transferase (PEP-CTERM system associated)
MLQAYSHHLSPKALLLAFTETTLIALSLLAGVKLRFLDDHAAFEMYTLLPDFAMQAVVVVLTFQVCFYYNDLYDLTRTHSQNQLLLRMGEALGAGCFVLGLLYFLIPGLLIGRGVFAIAMALTAASVLTLRLTLDAAWRMSGLSQRIVIVGTGPLAHTVRQEIRRREDLHSEVLGFVAGRNAMDDQEPLPQGEALLGSGGELFHIAEQAQIDRVIVAVEDWHGGWPADALVKLRAQGVEVEDAHAALAALTGRVWLEGLHPGWFLSCQGFQRSEAQRALKRSADLVLSVVALFLAVPLMLVVAAAIRLDSKGPIVYRQRRAGFRGRPFEMLKFRSMQADAELESGPQWALPNDPRITRTGKYLRRFRLDELPQFINVLRGGMSVVGPRPEIVDLLRQRIPYYDQRHAGRPGITGWAQVQYGYGANLEDALRKLEFDLFYLKNLSPLLDLLILLETGRIVLFGRGAR